MQLGGFRHSRNCNNNAINKVFYYISVVGCQIRNGIVINAPTYGDEKLQWVTITGNVIFGQPALSSAIAIGGGNQINISGNVIEAFGQPYGIIQNGGTVWQGNNSIMGWTTSKVGGSFQTY